MASESRKIRPLPFFMAKGTDRAGVVKALNAYLGQWPQDKNCKIVVSEAKSKRSEDQNALWWVWNHEIARFHDDSETPKYYHAWNKLFVALPLMRDTWERWREEGDFIAGMISVQTSFEAKLRIADACIETSALDTAEGSDYTEALQQYWHDAGVVLVIQAKPERYNHPEAQRA